MVNSGMEYIIKLKKRGIHLTQVHTRYMVSQPLTNLRYLNFSDGIVCNSNKLPEI